MTSLPPRPIARDHDLSAFDCGRPVLDDWLKRRALRNEESGASRTYVVCERNEVVAYYCLANGAVLHRNAPGRLRRNMPDPIPVMVIGRLAVHRRLHGQGFGASLLRDALMRTASAAEIAGIRAALVHALDEEAAAFYRRHGFLASPMDPLVLMMPLATVRAAMGDAGPGSQP